MVKALRLLSALSHIVPRIRQADLTQSAVIFM